MLFCLWKKKQLQGLQLQNCFDYKSIIFTPGSSKHNMADWCYHWLIIMHIIGNYIRIYNQKTTWLTQMALDFSRWSLRTKKRLSGGSETGSICLLLEVCFCWEKNPPQSFHMKITWKSAPWNRRWTELGNKMMFRFQPLNLEWVFHQILKYKLLAYTIWVNAGVKYMNCVLLQSCTTLVN